MNTQMKTLPRVINRPLIHPQTGAVLFVSLMFLIVLTMLGISALDSTKLETRMAANTKEYNQAFENAEAAVATATGVYRGDKITTLPTERLFDEFKEVTGLATGTARYRIMMSGNLDSKSNLKGGSTGSRFFLVESEGTSMKKDSETADNEATAVKLHAGIRLEFATDGGGVQLDKE